MTIDIEELVSVEERPPFHRYRADAHTLSGHLKYPVELEIPVQGQVSLRGVRGGRFSRHIERYSADDMISFQSGYTAVSGSHSEQHGWRTLSNSVLDGLNVFEVVTAARIVAQVSTEHPDTKGRKIEHVPRVTFLGTHFEDLRVSGYPLEIQLDLGICGYKPEGDRSYLEDRSLLERVRNQLERIARAEDLPMVLREEYDSKIELVQRLMRADGRRKTDPNKTLSLHCSLVESIGPIPIPGVRTIGNLIIIPDFGIVSLAEVEVGMQSDSESRDDVQNVEKQPVDNFFVLTMFKMRMGSIATGDAVAVNASAGGTTVAASAEELFDRPSGPSSKFVEKPADMEGTSVTRYPKIDLVVENRATREVLLTIDLGLSPDPRTKASSITVTAPEGWTELRIQTEITAPDLRFDQGQASGMIVVHNKGLSKPYKVRAFVTGDLKDQDTIEVHATFYYEGRNCGSARRAFSISEIFPFVPVRTGATIHVGTVTSGRGLGEQLRAGKAPDQVSTQLPEQSVIPETRREVPPIGYTTGTMDAPLGAKPPKLTVEIQAYRKEQGRQFWHLQMPDIVRDECTLPNNLRGEIDLKKDEPKYVAELFQVLDAIESGQHMSFFQGLGDRLYEMTPACFQEVYWLLFDKYGSFPIQIVSNDPYVPWELMRPSRPEGDNRGPDPEILARRHPVGRWLLDNEGSMPTRLKAGKVATIAPDYSQSPPHKRLKPLLAAQAESQRICARLGPDAVRITGRKQNVINMFEDANNEGIGLVHYAGHGACSAENADYAQLFLEDAELHPFDIRRRETQLGRNRRSLVFFNACGAGAHGLNLGVIGGFAEALIEYRFGGFIAPLWSVYDVDASVVVLEFLEHVLLTGKDQRQTFAAALKRIRNESAEKSPTFLSYTYYGDVMAAFV